MRTKLDFYIFIQKEFEDIKCAIIIHKSKDRQRNGQQKKNKRTNNDLQNTAENKRSSNTNTTENRWWNHVFRKGKQFMFY